MNKPVLNNYRFEKKFIIPERLTHSIEEVVKSNSALMRKIFIPRFINNIYFDNSRFQFFFENMDGVSERMKARIRWYGNLKGKIKKPVLLDMVVDQHENCFPMIPSGAAHNEILLGPDDQADETVNEEGMVLV